jgi:hypothetical protein
MPDSGRPGEASPAELEEGNSGKPGTSLLAKPEDKEPGKPGAKVAGSAGGCESRGNSVIGRWRSRGSRDRGFKEAWKREELKSRDLSLKHSRKMPEAGKPAEASERRDWRSEKPGKPGGLLQKDR